MRIYLSPKKNYAISVVIPMYNAAEYIEECLESLLLQTFQDFEVIVVDDCSTDNSVEIVTRYAPKFNDRLRLVKTEKNSSGAGYVPRNIGLNIANGRYVYFLDADDFILLTALELLYNEAKKYDADVICLDNYYYMNSPNEVVRKGVENKKKSFVIIDSSNRVVYECLFLGDMMTPWSKFARRDFLIENDIYFPEIVAGGDNVWSVHVCSRSKRFVRVIEPVYFYRCYDTKAITKAKREPREQTAWWVSSFVKLCTAWNEFAGKNEILRDSYGFHYKYLTDALNYRLKHLLTDLTLLNGTEIYTVLYRAFAKDSSDVTALLLPFLFSFIFEQKKNDTTNITDQFKSYFTARIDFTFVPKVEGDFKILSMSDYKAEVKKAGWLPKRETGYCVTSYAGKTEIVTKASADGQLSLVLRGIWVPNPADKSKRLPYWIDYTRLVINDKTIFDTLKPVWHDKPYNYTMAVKADEEIKITSEWLPHKDTRLDVSPSATKIQDNDDEKLRKAEALIAELRTALSNEKKAADKQRALVSELRTALADRNKVHDTNATLTSKSNDYCIARIDVKLMTQGDFKILSISDSAAKIEKPAWFQKDGTGYIIQSRGKEMELVVRSAVNGKIHLDLRGQDVRDKSNKSKRIPQWVDYTKLVINGKTLFDTLTPVWHNKPYVYDMDAKAGEQIKIQMKWLPHSNDT